MEAGTRDGTGKQTPQMRRWEIVSLLLKNDGTKIESLADELDVSPVTVYRDVQSLEDDGLVERRKGQIFARLTATLELPPHLRAVKAAAKKQLLCKEALSFLSAHQTVLIDDSSTVIPLLDLLPETMPLTVITNSLAVAQSVKNAKHLQLVLLGGRYYPWAESFYGTLATAQMQQIRADVCIMSDAAVWRGATYNPLDYVIDMKRAMLAHCDEAILLADSGKFTRKAWQKTTDLSAFSTIITDHETPAEQVEYLRNLGNTVRLTSPQ